MKLNKYQVFFASFVCYTAVHAVRTSFSYAKKSITVDIQVDSKYLGIVDALMLFFLGIGHFLHAVKPIKRPVQSAWIAMILCGINYELIPLSMLSKSLANIYVLSLLMSINGFLQSYTWPNLLMVIRHYFDPDNYAVLLGLWSANGNVGDVLGYGVFEILKAGGVKDWQYGLTICSIFASACGVYIGLRFKQLPITPWEQSGRRSIVIYKNQEVGKNKSGRKSITSNQNLQENLIIKNTGLKPIQNKNDEKSYSTPLSIRQVFKDLNILLLTINFSLTKSIKYGIILWLPLYLQTQTPFANYSAYIPMTYDVAAIFGSIGIGYLFNKIANKGLLMIPFMIVLFICFFFLNLSFSDVSYYFIFIAIVGLTLGGIFNTLAGLIIIELTKVIPENLKTSSLGFYSALTMAIGNITTALTQILIGFVIGKQNATGIFVVFMIYTAICFVCFVMIAIITRKQKGKLSQIDVIQQPIENYNGQEYSRSQ